MMTNTKNEAPLFKIGDKVIFGKFKGIVISDRITPPKIHKHPFYVVRFEEKIGVFIEGIPDDCPFDIKSVPIVEFLLKKDLITDIKAGDIFLDKAGKTIKLIQTPFGNFHLGGKNGNLDFLFSNEIFSKEEMLEKINKEEWVKKD